MSPRTRLLSRSKPVRPTALVCPWSFQWAVDSLRSGEDSLGHFTVAPLGFQGVLSIVVVDVAEMYADGRGWRGGGGGIHIRREGAHGAHGWWVGASQTRVYHAPTSAGNGVCPCPCRSPQEHLTGSSWSM